MSADLYFTSVPFSFFLLLSFFFRRLISEVAEQNSTKIGHMVGSKCNFKTHVRNLGYPSSTNRGPQNHLFWTNSQLNGNFNGLYFWKETWYRQSVKCVDNYKGSLTSSQKMVHKRLQTRPAFLPTLHKSCILLHCQALQMEIIKRNSTKLCQVMVVSRPNKLP